MKDAERGNILLSSILMVAAISMGGAALVQSSLRDNAFAGYREQQENTFRLAESCVEEGASWLRTTADAAESLPHAIAKTAENLYTGQETARERTKLGAYSMSCTVTGPPSGGGPVALSALSPSSPGETANDQGGYGLSGDLSPKVYFWISSQGDGPSGAKKRVSAVVSAQY